MTTCPAGHRSEATDYCDVCGAAMAPAPAAEAPASTPPSAADLACPHCGTSNLADALFCEACGYDFTTGTLPRGVADTEQMAAINPDEETPRPADPPPPSDVAAAAAQSPAPSLPDLYVVEVWIDPDWYADQGATDPLPSPGLPQIVAIRHSSVLIGRSSRSRNISPDIDLSNDAGVSRRHAQLTTDGTRWFVEDLNSSNGTYVGSAVGGLPKSAIEVGIKRELADDDRIYLGGWTRLVVREGVPGEV